MYSLSVFFKIPKLDSDIEKLKQYFYINQYVTILFRRGKLVKLLSVFFPIVFSDTVNSKCGIHCRQTKFLIEVTFHAI